MYWQRKCYPKVVWDDAVLVLVDGVEPLDLDLDIHAGDVHVRVGLGALVRGLVVGHGLRHVVGAAISRKHNLQYTEHIHSYKKIPYKTLTQYNVKDLLCMTCQSEAWTLEARWQPWWESCRWTDCWRRCQRLSWQWPSQCLSQPWVARSAWDWHKTCPYPWIRAKTNNEIIWDL